MRAQVYIREDNEYFWENLDNKSGWVNYMIELTIEAGKKEQELRRKYEKNETDVVQDTLTEAEGEVPVW